MCFFLNTCELACFQIDETSPLSRERLNRSFKGDDKNSLRILLLIKSGPDALPVRRERNVDLTSSDVILRDWRLLGVSEALCSSKIVCCIKNSFSLSVFCSSLQ